MKDSSAPIGLPMHLVAATLDQLQLQLTTIQLRHASCQCPSQTGHQKPKKNDKRHLRPSAVLFVVGALVGRVVRFLRAHLVKTVSYLHFDQT